MVDNLQSTKFAGDGLHRVENAERMGGKLNAQAGKHVQVAGEFPCESQDAFQVKHVILPPS